MLKQRFEDGFSNVRLSIQENEKREIEQAGYNRSIAKFIKS
jgi:hypothetical protein